MESFGARGRPTCMGKAQATCIWKMKIDRMEAVKGVTFSRIMGRQKEKQSGCSTPWLEKISSENECDWIHREWEI